MHLAMRLHLAKAKKPAVNPSEPPDYEERPDGGFECLHCDKTYDPSSRAESYIKAHVMKEHR